MNPENEPIYNYQPLWGGWRIDGFIGKGSFGNVYKVSKEDMGYKYVSTVKIITVPSDEQYREARASFGNDERTMFGYFQDIVSNIIEEINLLYGLRGSSNIISYEDHMVVKREGKIGWDVLLRMEHATSFTQYITEHPLTLEQVVQLGADVCSALCSCEKAGIIHRDIKDENIFVSDKGVFKLGDFGTAKELSKSGRAASRMGTPLYMAPEVYHGEKYDLTADIYSLGIVMYKLLNNGRLPFMPDYPADVRYVDSEIALEKRMAGEPLPQLKKDYGKLTSIILKACSFNPNERHPSALVMKKELEAFLEEAGDAEKSKPVTLPKGTLDSANLLNSGIAGSIGNSKVFAYADTIPLYPNMDYVKEQLLGNETIRITGIDTASINDEYRGQADASSRKEKQSDSSSKVADHSQQISVNELCKAATKKEKISDEDLKRNKTITILLRKKKMAIGAMCVIIASIIITLFALGNDKKLETALETSISASTVNTFEESANSTTVESTRVDSTIESVAQNSVTIANMAQITSNEQTEITVERPVIAKATAAVVTSASVTQKADRRNKTQENKTTKTSTARNSKAGTKKTPATPTKVAQTPVKAEQTPTEAVQTPTKVVQTSTKAVQTPTPAARIASISDFKLYVTYGDTLSLKVISPGDDRNYTYFFTAKENKGESLGMIKAARVGPGTYSWDPPKEDTYYFITLQVKGLDGQITGISN